MRVLIGTKVDHLNFLSLLQSRDNLDFSRMRHARGDWGLDNGISLLSVDKCLTRHHIIGYCGDRYEQNSFFAVQLYRDARIHPGINRMILSFC